MGEWLAKLQWDGLLVTTAWVPGERYVLVIPEYYFKQKKPIQ